eukprot:scaffold26289_cov264-Cylindrotheca_fusiformis.AAC.2
MNNINKEVGDTGHSTFEENRKAIGLEQMDFIIGALNDIPPGTDPTPIMNPDKINVQHRESGVVVLLLGGKVVYYRSKKIQPTTALVSVQRGNLQPWQKQAKWSSTYCPFWTKYLRRILLPS